MKHTPCKAHHHYPTRSIVVMWVKSVQTELTSEIYSKSSVRATGKILLIKSSQNTN